MCLCKGVGGIRKIKGYVAEFIPCPDSHCTFDREKAEREYKEWRDEFDKHCEQLRSNHSA